MRTFPHLRRRPLSQMETTNTKQMEVLNNNKQQEPVQKAEVSCLQLATEFCRWTTAHGWGRVVRTPLRCLQALWVTITLAALALNAGHIALLATAYLSFDTEIRWQVRVSEIPFPSITICNTQPMSQSTKEAMAQDASTKLHDWEKVLKNINSFDELAAVLNKSEEFERVKYKLHEPSGYFQNIGQEYRHVGHQPHDFLIGCHYGQELCSAYNFTPFYSQDYFNCYTFNAGNQTLMSPSTGPMAGLSLILYLETDNRDEVYDGHYDKYLHLGNTAGLRVTIHTPSSRPYPLEQGFDIPPGFSASIKLKVQLHTWLDTPYGDCIKGNEELPAFLSRLGYNYTMSDCLQLCKQRHVNQTCGCSSSLLPIPDILNPLVSYCGRWHVRDLADLQAYFTRVACENNAINSYDTKQMIDECGCRAPCAGYQYHTDISYSQWPIESSQAEFYKLYILDNPQHESLKAYTNLWGSNMSEMIERGLIAKNFARMNVYIQDPIVDIHSQKASYEWPKLASDIGGTFGLWIGMSLITWCEALEFIVNVARLQITKISKRKNREDSESKNLAGDDSSQRE